MKPTKQTLGSVTVPYVGPMSDTRDSCETDNTWHFLTSICFRTTQVTPPILRLSQWVAIRDPSSDTNSDVRTDAKIGCRTSIWALVQHRLQVRSCVNTGGYVVALTVMLRETAAQKGYTIIGAWPTGRSGRMSISTTADMFWICYLLGAARHCARSSEHDRARHGPRRTD